MNAGSGRDRKSLVSGTECVSVWLSDCLAECSLWAPVHVCDYVCQLVSRMVMLRRQHAAATAIQALWRGHRQRMALRRWLSSGEKVLHSYHGARAHPTPIAQPFPPFAHQRALHAPGSTFATNPHAPMTSASALCVAEDHDYARDTSILRSRNRRHDPPPSGLKVVDFATTGSTGDSVHSYGASMSTSVHSGRVLPSATFAVMLRCGSE